MAAALFEFDDLRLERAGRPLLSGLTASLPDGVVTVIAGPSGSGKSSLLRLCNRLVLASRGIVRYRGRNVLDLDPLSLRRQVGMVFQRSTALPGTVADNLRAAAPEATPMAVADALARVDLAGFEARAASTLSGGQTQRMCVARTLLTEPRVVLWDEPTSALDPATTSVVERLVAELTDQGTPSVWVTHDMAQLRRIAQHVVFLVDGRAAQSGPSRQVLAQPAESVVPLLGHADR